MDDSGELRQRFSGPRAYGAWREGAPVRIGAAEDRSQMVWVRFEVQLSEGLISAIRFQVLGCQHVMAAASRVAESLLGKPLSALDNIHPQDLQRALAVPQEKLGRLLVIEDAARACAESAD